MSPAHRPPALAVTVTLTNEDLRLLADLLLWRRPHAGAAVRSVDDVVARLLRALRNWLWVGPTKAALLQRDMDAQGLTLFAYVRALLDDRAELLAVSAPTRATAERELRALFKPEAPSGDRLFPAADAAKPEGETR